MTVDSVVVNGRPASFMFVQPTYPGDPNGQDDPDPRAHQASQVNPVGGPQNNPLPPACTPAVTGNDVNAQNGDPCPANKLVITPFQRIPDRRQSSRSRCPTPVARACTPTATARPRAGSATTSPSGRRWLRHHRAGRHRGLDAAQQPSEREADLRLLRHGHRREDRGRQRHAALHQDNPPDAQFPGGSTTWHWQSPAPIASYLVENSVGNVRPDARATPSDGILYYEAQASAIDPAQKQANMAIMDQQQDITDFQSQFNGPFPFTSNGVLVGIPQAGFEEEMQTKITFQGGRIGLRDVPPREHAPVVGRQRLRGQLQPDVLQGGHGPARRVPVQRPHRSDGSRRPGHACGRRGVRREPGEPVQHELREHREHVDQRAVGPDAGHGCSPLPLTYNRPATAYIALRQILGKDNFTAALQQIQRDYRHSRSPRRNSRPSTTPSCRTRVRRATPGSTSSSPSGSTRCTQPAAGIIGRSSPALGWLGQASTTRMAPAAELHRLRRLTSGELPTRGRGSTSSPRRTIARRARRTGDAGPPPRIPPSRRRGRRPG